MAQSAILKDLTDFNLAKMMCLGIGEEMNAGETGHYVAYGQQSYF